MTVDRPPRMCPKKNIGRALLSGNVYCGYCGGRSFASAACRGHNPNEPAVQSIKDLYVFDIIPFREDLVERDIEEALVRDVTKMLLELGTGFALLGNQYHLNAGGDRR